MTPGIKAVSTRPRSQRTHAAVLDATLALLREVGFPLTTIERIAAASGVSTASIYKHWPSKNAIVAEAFGRYVNEALPITTTDDPLGDLRSFAVEAMTFHSQAGETTFAHLLSACALEESGQAYLHEYYLGPRREMLKPLWSQAVEAGLVRDDVEEDLAMDLIFGAAVFRMLRGSTAPSRETVRQMIELSLDSLTTPAARKDAR